MGVQVNGLYRNEDGSPRSILKRQFISFSYDEKDIEEFGLIVVFDGQGLDKEVYAPFQDITTEQEELNGQLFWRSKFNANKLSFTLATDGMTVQQLERFKFHFRPGYNKELILSEHHNRAILARVASAPKMKLTPFEHREEIEIGKLKYPVITTLYKGEISLDFVMDDPHWYSIKSYQDNIYQPPKKDISDDIVGVTGIQKADGTIVLNGTINDDSALYFSLGGKIPKNQPFKIFLNNSTAISSDYSNVDFGFRLLDKTAFNSAETRQYDKLISFCTENAMLSSQQSFDLIGIQIKLIKPTTGDITFDNFTIKPEIYLDKDVKVFHEDGVPFKNLIASSCFLADKEYAEIGEKVTITSMGISLDKNSEKKLYYCGTAPANPVISFDLTLTQEDNKKLSLERDNYNEYPYISVGNKKIHFDLPSIFTSYNYVLDTIELHDKNSSVIDIRRAIQSVTYDYYTRTHAMKVIDTLMGDEQYVDKVSSQVTETFKGAFIDNFSQFFDNSNKLHCEINNQNGMVSIKVKVKINGEEKEITEKAGNMIKSNYLIIEPSDSNYQTIESNVSLENLQINYKYMYL